MAKLTLILLAAPMALASLSVPAAARDDGERHSVVVRYDDLNLASAAGRDRLTMRVKSAARTVCGTRPHHRQGLSERTSALRCQESVLADADVKLAALFNGDATRLADRGQVVVSAP